MNSISSLLRNPFLMLSHNEQVKIKELGRPLPLLTLQSIRIVHNAALVSQFNSEIYTKNDWLCGNDENNALYCFPCILFGGNDCWSSSGYKDLFNLNEDVEKHEMNSNHLHNIINLSAIGKKSTKTSLNEQKKVIERQNIQIEKNLEVLKLLIDSIKFCGQNYYPILKRVYADDDDDGYTLDSDAFEAFLEFVLGPKNTLKNYLKIDIFKKDLESIKIDIINSIAQVYHHEIIKEVNKTEFISIIIEELSGNDDFPKVIILRYVLDNKPVERVWKLLKYQQLNNLCHIVKDELSVLIKNGSTKLVAQSYMELNLRHHNPSTNIHHQIQSVYPNANLVHFYRHNLQDIIINTKDFNQEVRFFFINLWSISDFFSNKIYSNKPREIFENIVKEKQNQRKEWNFETDLLNTVNDYNEEISETMVRIQEDTANYDSNIICKAYNIEHVLEEDDFQYWLETFHRIMPYIENLINEFENCLKPLESDFNTIEENMNMILSDKFNHPLNTHLIEVKIEEDYELFQSNVENVKVEENCSNVTTTLSSKKRKHTESRNQQSKEVISCILLQLQERLKFRGHIFASRLVDPKNFRQYSLEFPDSFLETTVESFPFLNGAKLKTELKVLYSRLAYQILSDSCALLTEISESQLKSSFQESSKLLNIILTIPTKTIEKNRCFSTLDKIEYFLKHNRDIEYSESLLMLAYEKDFVDSIYEFTDKVVRIFSEKPGRPEHFKRHVLPDEN